MVFEKNPECKEPSDIVAVPGETTANVTWNANGGPKWDVRVTNRELSHDELSNAEYDNYVFKADNVDKAEIEVTGLKPNRNRYYFYIRPVCENGEVVWSASTEIITECRAAETLPYVMDFNGYDISKQESFVVPCLYAPLNSAGYPKLNKETSMSGLSCVTGNYESVKNKAYVAFPNVDESYAISDLQIGLYVNVNNPNTQFAIGVMTDPADLATFDTVKVVTIEKAAEWKEVIEILEGYDGTGRNIALCADMPVYFDDVVIKEKMSCVKVGNLKASDITDTQATVSWTAGMEQNWDLLISDRTLSYGELGSLFENPEAGVRKETVGSNPATISDLVPNKTYYVYVRSHCTAGAGDWANRPVSFTTLCGAVNVGDDSFDSFEHADAQSAPMCWVVTGKDAPKCQMSYKHSGEYSLLMHSTKGNDTYAVSPLYTEDDLRNVQLSFWGTSLDKATSQYEHRIIVGVVSSQNDLGSFVAIDTVEGMAAEMFYVVSFEKYKGSVDGSSYAGCIAFRSNFDKENYFYIDDVRIDEKSDCAAPHTIDIATLTDNTAWLSILGGTAPYNVIVTPRVLTAEELADLASLADDADIKVLDSPDGKANFSGLEPNSSYYVYARSACGDAAEGWSNVIRFNTACKTEFELPYIEDFASTAVIGQFSTPD